MLRLTIGGGGTAAMDRVLGVCEKVVGDMRPIWEKVLHPYLLLHMYQQFESLGAAGGKPWQSLDAEPRYKAYKAQLVGKALANKVLWWDPKYARLRPSLIHATHKDHGWFSLPDKAFFGTYTPWASDLITGGRGPDETGNEPYPGRDIFAMTQSQRKELVTLIQREIVKQVRRRGYKMTDARQNL